MQAYCRSKNLPTELEQRGVKFIDSKHRSQQIIDARATVQDMPPSLQDDIFWASAHLTPGFCNLHTWLVLAAGFGRVTCR